MKKLFAYFSRIERVLWSTSVILIVLSFCAFDRESYLTLIASLIGVTSLIFNAKGNPIGQALMIVFSLLYGMISYTFSYYSEMITYLGMTMPMAAFALIAWLRNPYRGNKAEVKVNSIGKAERHFDCFMDIGKSYRYTLYLRSCLFRCIPVQRYLRIYQLATDEKKAIRIMKRHSSNSGRSVPL